MSLYSGVLGRDVTQQFFMELPYKQFMARSAGGMNNPLAPCSLLRALVLASRFTLAWGAVIAMSGEPRVRENPPAAAEAAAVLFADAMREAAAKSAPIMKSSTQQQCLDWLFDVDFIRR